jgi:hypothetical protein
MENSFSIPLPFQEQGLGTLLISSIGGTSQSHWFKQEKPWIQVGSDGVSLYCWWWGVPKHLKAQKIVSKTGLCFVLGKDNLFLCFSSLGSYSA